MAIVQSFGALQAKTDTHAGGGTSAGSLSLYSATAQSYAAIYRTQPNVRTVVDFLARNVAQLGVHVYRRVSDLDRVRVRGHQVSTWLERPNPATSRYRLVESLMCDLGIYFNAYWLKVRADESLGLIRLPPAQMRVEGGLLPRVFVWTTPDGKETPFAPSEVVSFGGYNPGENALMGLSPLETLRRVLAEEHAASQYREQFWSNSARFEGVIERPKDAPKWTPEQRESWREQWQAKFGNGGSGAGSVAVLTDGMTFKQTSFSAKDAEFVSARKLTREECAAAYHVPLPMVGILEHATFSNIKEQHKHLYQDSLGPWLVMIQQDLERQLLIEADDQRDIYLEFNIAAKLAGSFEEQATSLQALVGRPVMTVNEGRARLNLPHDPDPESDKVAPQQGGPAATPKQVGAGATEDARAEAVASTIQATQVRQRARLAKVPDEERVEAFTAALPRWNRELATDLAPLVGDDEADRLSRAVNAITLAAITEQGNA